MPDPTFLHLEAVPTTWPPYDKVAVANFDYTAEQAQVVIAKMVSKDSGLRNGGDENLVKSKETRRHHDFQNQAEPQGGSFSLRMVFGGHAGSRMFATLLCSSLIMGERFDSLHAHPMGCDRSLMTMISRGKHPRTLAGLFCSCPAS